MFGLDGYISKVLYKVSQIKRVSSIPLTHLLIEKVVIENKYFLAFYKSFFFLCITLRFFKGPLTNIKASNFIVPTNNSIECQLG